MTFAEYRAGLAANSERAAIIRIYGVDAYMSHLDRKRRADVSRRMLREWSENRTKEPVATSPLKGEVHKPIQRQPAIATKPVKPTSKMLKVINV